VIDEISSNTYNTQFKGRIIHFMKKKYLKPFGVKILCLDEADKMLDMGFEAQVRSICGQLRPDRLTLMFSATFKPNVQKLAKDLLIYPLRINVGAIGSVNKDIDQIAVVMNDESQKWGWLEAKLPQFVKEGSVLIFVAQKQNADTLAENLANRGFIASCTHGDKSQQTRNKIHFAFKNGNLPILVATDVASRGLDIGTVKTVIQFDPPKSIDVHTHRVGRTGRAGERGTAYALMSMKDSKFASIMVSSMRQGGQLFSCFNLS
jgi:ATP-dependent RNA helicase DDX42